jgi:hypothetical protein
MDWRLQGAALTAGFMLANVPFLFGPDTVVGPSTFVSSWRLVASVMQYLVIASLVLIILGIFWRGPIGRSSAWIQMFTSFGLGCWMLLVSVGTSFVTIDYSALTPTVAPAQNLLTIGLLVPTLSFASSLAWLFWDGRHGPEYSTGISQSEIRRRQFEDTSESIVASIVASVMTVLGVGIILETSSALFLIVGAGMIALSVVVFVLEVSRQIKRPR